MGDDLSHAVAQGPWALLHTPELMDVVLTAAREVAAGMVDSMPAGDVHGTPDTTETTSDPRRQGLCDRMTELAGSGGPVWEKQWMVLILIWLCPGLRQALHSVAPATVGAFLDTLPNIMATHVFGTPLFAATPPVTAVMLIIKYLQLSYFHTPPPLSA